uniref:F-box domain-containing protein n=1 Tax=Quercus lobata TaxID=97700 RepID=A0A7N2LM56_QUELO
MEKQRKQNKQEGDDRISVLPEPIIHEILSHLHDTKAAARTSVLSKTWQRAWASFPCVVFNEWDFDARSSESPDNSPEENGRIRIKKNAFMTYINKTLRSRDSSVEEFALQLTHHDKVLLLPRVVEWLTIATERKVKALDEQVIQNLTLRCPLVEDFRLICCHGLKHLKVSNLPRLNLLHVLARRKVSRIEIKAPSLQTFYYWSKDSYRLQSVNVHCDIYLEACKNLKRLELVGLSNRTIELLQTLSSKFPTLEVLEIPTCKMASVKISSQTLKMLKLEKCTDLEELVGKFNSTEGLNLVIHSESKVILLDGLNERVLSSGIDLKDLRPAIVIISSMSSSDLVERMLLDYSVETLSILSNSSKLLEVLNEKLLKKLFKSEGLHQHESFFDVKVEKIDGEEDPKYSKWIALLKSYKAVDYQTTNFKIDWKND